MRALITGGARGLGRACVSEALSRDAHVVVVDADAAALDALPPRVVRLRADLADGNDIAAVIERLAQEPPFDLVIMNAGINETGHFERQPLERLHRVIAVNLTAQMQLTAALIRDGKLAPRARLVFMSSLSHFVGYPGASVYAATKDGVVVFARSLRRTLRKSLNVRVQVAAPGPMDTDHAARHAPAAGKQGARIAPERVAALIWRSRRRFMIVPGLRAQTASVLGRLFPGLAGQTMRRIIYDRLGPEHPISKEPAE
jgi:NAD(P)-dependent dehydrogenase (short-subunit alcohol dehydrogenase family)